MAKEAPTLAIIIDDSGGSARTITNDITACDWQTPRGVQDITGVDKAATERLLLLADYSATYNGVFNDGANMSHAVFKTVPSASVTRTVSVAASGQTLAVEALLTDYQLSRPISGELTWTVPAVLQSGAAPTWA
tara:strand:- start:502 stop:903 length:402 start_codon:yes stop_codon:yes gene_type:complete